MGSKMQMKRLIEERNKLAAEIEAKTHRLSGLDQAIALLQEGEEDDQNAIPRRIAIKDPVLRLLEEFKEGLTAAEVIEVGRSKGHNLSLASVSSLLSRLKKEGTLSFDQATSKYRLAAIAQAGTQQPSNTSTAAPTAPAVQPAVAASAAPQPSPLSSLPPTKRAGIDPSELHRLVVSGRVQNPGVRPIERKG